MVMRISGPGKRPDRGNGRGQGVAVVINKNSYVLLFEMHATKGPISAY